MARGLTPKQERFAQEYLVDLNGSAAYRRAGYAVKNERVARTEAARLLANPAVAAAIAAGRERQAARTEAKAAEVIAELLALAYSDVGHVLDFSGESPRLRPAHQIPAAARRAIASVKVRRYTEGRGDDAREVEVTEFKLWDKPSALDKLCRHLGLFNDQVTVKTGDVPDLSKMSHDDRLKLLAALRPLFAPGAVGAS